MTGMEKVSFKMKIGLHKTYHLNHPHYLQDLWTDLGLSITTRECINTAPSLSEIIRIFPFQI